MDSVAILDFGSQYSQLIARRIREAQVYCELFPYDAPEEKVMALQPKAFILSGGPNSVYDPGAAGHTGAPKSGRKPDPVCSRRMYFKRG
jgi:GMP synthase-like glutamine amidotransferase